MRNKKRLIRKVRIRKKIFGTAKCPRLCVFKSNQHLYAQVIDDNQGSTLASVSDLKIKKENPKEKAKKIGELIAKDCFAKKINNVIFDRGGYQYIGLIKIMAESARKNGLRF